MDFLKPVLKEAFSGLARDSVHPGGEEIAAALDGAGSAFAAMEIRAHLGWCDSCRAVADDYEAFRNPLSPATRHEEDAAWRAMRSRLPSPRKQPLRWLPIAAAIAIAAGPLLVWLAMRNQPPVIQERIVERTISTPVQVAATALVDLRPEGSRERSAGERQAPAIPSGSLIAFVLYETPAEESPARVLDTQGRVLWSGQLRRQRGVYTLALGEEILRSRPLTIECGAVRYRIP